MTPLRSNRIGSARDEALFVLLAFWWQLSTGFPFLAERLMALLIGWRSVIGWCLFGKSDWLAVIGWLPGYMGASEVGCLDCRKWLVGSDWFAAWLRGSFESSLPWLRMLMLLKFFWESVCAALGYEDFCSHEASTGYFRVLYGKNASRGLEFFEQFELFGGSSSSSSEFLLVFWF